LACLSAEVLDALPPVIWFIRAKLRNHRKGVSLPQFRTLVMVDQQPLTCLSTLAEFLGASLSTASRIAGGLVDKGL
jgi:DNA-binding MarR family transcriptional regulator